MTGLQTVVNLRREGFKPSAVVIDLVETISPIDTEENSLSASGIVSVNIARTDSLSDIDFRPLHGLTVHLHGERLRQARAAKLIAEVHPTRLVVPVERLDGWTVHIRHADKPAEAFPI